MFVLMFLLVGAFFIISEEKLALKSSESTDKFFSLYRNWIANVLGNLGDLTGYVLKMEWLPSENNT